MSIKLQQSFLHGCKLSIKAEAEAEAEAAAAAASQGAEQNREESREEQCRAWGHPPWTMPRAVSILRRLL